MHIDTLFGEPGKNVIDFDLIKSQCRYLLRVAVSVREDAISSATLLKRLAAGFENATYAAFREVGRVIRTMQLRYLSDAPLAPRYGSGPAPVRPHPRRPVRPDAAWRLIDRYSSSTA
ncbi:MULTISPECIES: Tn3 family transposase [unclassified Streptomyces]|uniref:Tn3 family transposase n=1 Tax=unclassified Streptomyces TaxID=2593676 RepID=UPI0029A2AC69|nr:Tn3 family transposase [Streptomyces sp. DK15]MDX2394876.1 transposase [Streptomyces sp. DK15]